MRSITAAYCSARLYSLADAELCLFPNTIFYVFRLFTLTGASSRRIGEFRTDNLTGAADKFIHGVQPCERIAGIVEAAFIDRLQILIDVTACQCSAAKYDW